MTVLNRRQFIKTAGGVVAGSALAGCGSSATLPKFRPPLGGWPAPTPASTWRLLNRVTFGPRPEERHRLTDIGPAAFIEEQLAPETLEEMELRPRLRVRRLETLQLALPDLFDVAEEVVTRELQQAALLRAVYSRRQLYEVMVNFWSNHFNIAQTKGDCAWLKTVDDREVIRPHALGNFRDLLHASAHSPAMLVYLDNQENLATNPNENYARELMELHTLGVDGGYTQTDVRELARCLTGWTIKQYFYRGQFTFHEDRHDNGPKMVLGRPVPAGINQAGGEQVIDMLANHPATARFIAGKLARRFVADEPPPGLVAAAARTFLDTRGDIKAVLRTVLLSTEMLAPRNHAPAKLKRPLEYVVSALRQLNVDTDGGSPLLKHLAEMGQPLFQWPTPDGYPDRAEPWRGTLLTRWRFALALVNNDIPGTALYLPTLLQGAATETPTRLLIQLAVLLLGQPLPEEVAGQLVRTSQSETALMAVLLGSPMFQWK